PRRCVVIDGRTFLRPGQLQSLLDLAAALGETPRIIECVCDDAVARERLERDLAEGDHPAKNRTFPLYHAGKAAAAPTAVPPLVPDTGTMPLEECVRRCLEYLGERSEP